MNINFEKASFKDFEDIPQLDAYARAEILNDYLDYRLERGQLNYRLLSKTGSGPVMDLIVPGIEGVNNYVSLVSNDYLGFTQHPKVKAAAISGIEQYGTGSGASPAIGGHMEYHQQIEDSIAAFFGRESALIYTTGYTANSATLQCLLRKDDIAILDMAVHTSVYEGCYLTNVKRFPHNNLEALEMTLKNTRDKYRMRMVVIDGVYSQDGDFAPLDQIVKLCKLYGATLMVDDAHGTGVIGKTGRGVIEHYNLFQEVDIITGTFSKAFGHLGGYVVASPKLIRYLKFQSKQHLFSVTAMPASLGILKAMELLDEEPFWMERLWDNIHYLKGGLQSLGLDTGITQSAIMPVKIGDSTLNAEVCTMLLKAGIFTNQINYPAVATNDARIRMSVMATHTKEHLDNVLNAFEWVIKKTELRTKIVGLNK